MSGAGFRTGTGPGEVDGRIAVAVVCSAVSPPEEAAMSANRRSFVRTVTMLGVGAQTLLHSRSLRAAVTDARESVADTRDWPEMTYRTLGRTGFRGSRLVFGCGAALSRKRADHLLNAAFDAGVNVFDVGSRGYYRDAETNLAPFLAQRRDAVFLISKAQTRVGVGPGEEASGEQRRTAAQNWSTQLDGSLRELGVERVDAYYVMGANNRSILLADEVWQAFEQARAAGKVRFFGLSTHENAEELLEAASASGRFDLAQIAITPAGWYDWNKRSIKDGTPPMTAIQPLLDRARAAGIGLIGMKAGRFLAGRGLLQRGNETAFDRFYDQKLLGASLSSFQRSYAYVLEHGLDAVNADMQAWAHLRENFIAAATSHTIAGGTATA
jgi:aryl-alcohol dehydrogenase-like predicted oxidoreductase